MIRPPVAAAVCAVALMHAAPPGLASQSAPDSVIIHSVYAGEPLRQLLAGVAAEAKGAFVPEEADRLHREAWGSGASPSRYNPYQQQIKWSFSYLNRDRDDNSQGILGIRLLSSQPRMFDVGIKTSDPKLMKAIRKMAAALELDSLGPIDRIRLVLKEERSPGTDPKLVLRLETVRQYGCSGYYIDYDWSQEADTVWLTLHGVSRPPGPCAPAIGPATLSRDMFLGRREYTVYLIYQDRTDRLFFDITDSTTAVTVRDSSLVQADERPRLRYPRNSFVFRCANMARNIQLCSEVDFWLTAQRGITRYDFPRGGINPFLAAPGGRPGEGVRFLRYDSPTSFEYLRLCFAAIDSAVRTSVGVNLTLEDWLGNTISAASQTAFRDEHTAVPERVTEQPACVTPFGTSSIGE